MLIAYTVLCRRHIAASQLEKPADVAPDWIQCAWGHIPLSHRTLERKHKAERKDKYYH